METRKVVFGSIEDCRKYLRYAESFPYDLDLCYGSRVVDGKSILGILSFGMMKKLELVLHTDDCCAIERLMEKISFCFCDMVMAEAM